MPPASTARPSNQIEAPPTSWSFQRSQRRDSKQDSGKGLYGFPWLSRMLALCNLLCFSCGAVPFKEAEEQKQPEKTQSKERWIWYQKQWLGARKDEKTPENIWKIRKKHRLGRSSPNLDSRRNNKRYESAKRPRIQPTASRWTKTSGASHSQRRQPSVCSARKLAASTLQRRYRLCESEPVEKAWESHRKALTSRCANSVQLFQDHVTSMAPQWCSMIL